MKICRRRVRRSLPEVQDHAEANLSLQMQSPSISKAVQEASKKSEEIT